MPSDLLSDLERQVRLSRMLSMGFALSLVGAAGLGSLAAFLIGLKALTVINRSPVELAGKWMAWWCIIFGGLGVLVIPIYVLYFFFLPDK
jgi:hypothetical protein